MTKLTFDAAQGQRLKRQGLDQVERDMPGMLDALLHLLEKAGLVQDDAQVVSLIWTPFPLDRERPQCTVTIKLWEE